MSLTSAAVVSLIALASPLLVRLVKAPVPDLVLQILLGVLVGPQVLGWASVDQPVRVLSLIGLAFLLLLAGLEIEPDWLRGRTLRLAVVGFVVSFAVALAIGLALGAADLVASPLLVAVLLSATGLGLVLPVLEDAGILDTALGRLVSAGASVAEIVPIVMLSLLFAGETAGVGARLVLLTGFLLAVVAAGLLIVGLERSSWLSRALVALQDTTAEIRVRGVVALLMVFAAAAVGFGLEAILGAFLAGLAITLVDRDRAMTHTQLRFKLKAVGFGVLVPFFFVATGMSLNVRALADDPSTLARVPVFLVALLLARGLPALLYRRWLSTRAVAAAALLQATSLGIPVVGGQIGVDLGLIRPQNYVALVVAGLLSVVVFAPLALRLQDAAPGTDPAGEVSRSGRRSPRRPRSS